MDEKIYRQSRLCRLLGNPSAFAIVDVLGAGKELSPSEVARAVSRSVSRVSHVLEALLRKALTKFIDTSSAFQR